MLTKIIICQQNNLIYTFAYSFNRLAYVLKDTPELATEAIFKARLSKYNQNSRTAFIEYLPGHCGYLNLPPELAVQEGSIIPVQLIWMGDNNKQPKFRYGWQLVGKYVVYLANSPQRISSKNLNSPHTREQLVDLLTKTPGNWVVRSNVQELSDLQLLKQEMSYLYQQAKEIQNNLSHKNQAGFANYLKLIRELPLASNCEIISNNDKINNELLHYQQLWQIDAITLDKSLNINELIDNYEAKLQTTQINLNNGASLEIHSLSGINLIDVNSDKIVTSNNSLNFIVLDDIYHQILFRNLQGIILIDFIKNMPKTEQNKIITYLEKLFKIDISHTKVLGFTNAGLCELVRNKF